MIIGYRTYGVKVTQDDPVKVRDDPVIVVRDGDTIDDEEAFRQKLQEYFDNELKNSMIEWKRE